MWPCPRLKAILLRSHGQLGYNIGTQLGDLRGFSEENIDDIVGGIKVPRAHTHATAFDLVLWAIMVGAFDLAEVLWKHKSCGSPLRAALIGQNMCKKIELSKKVRVKELQKLARTLSKHSLGMLDFLQDQEEARKLLLSRDGPLGTVGMAGSRRGSLMDLAIDFNNSDFVSHRYSQEILNEQWMGRSPQCGRIRLSDMVGVTRLVLQILAMPSSFKFVSTDVNDLFPHWGDDEVTVTVRAAPRSAC